MRPFLLCVLVLQFHEPHEHRGALGAGRGALRDEGGVGDAGDDAGAAGPLHRRDGVLADGREVGVAEYVRALADADIIALRDRVAPEHRRKLFTGDIVLASTAE